MNIWHDNTSYPQEIDVPDIGIDSDDGWRSFFCVTLTGYQIMGDRMWILTPPDIDDSSQETHNQIKILLTCPVALERTKDFSVWIQPLCSCREGNDRADKLQGTLST